jgi:hypothetical protein
LVYCTRISQTADVYYQSSRRATEASKTAMKRGVLRLVCDTAALQLPCV